MSLAIVTSFAVSALAAAWGSFLFLRSREIHHFLFLSIFCLMTMRNWFEVQLAGSFQQITLLNSLDELTRLLINTLVPLCLLAVDRMRRKFRKVDEDLSLQTQEHTRTKDRLRESVERLAVAAKNANDGLWDWDLATGRVTRSDRWYEMIGYKPSSIPETYDGFLEHVHPSDREQIQRSTDELCSGSRDVAEYEFRLRHLDGHWVHIVARATARRKGEAVVGISGSHFDISKQKSIENQLRESEERFRLAVSQVAVWDWDVGKDKLFMSEGFRKLLGYSEAEFEEILANSITTILHPEDLPGYRDRLFAHLENPGLIYTNEHRFRTRDGEYKWFLAKGESHAETQNGTIRSIGVLTEITEKKALEESLRYSHRMEAIGQLTGGIAHDFNNLMSVIQGNAELLALRNESLVPLASDILCAVTRGAELTQRLLAYSGRLQLAPESVEVARLMNDIKSVLSRTLGENISVSTELHGDVSSVFVDYGQLENALLNLAINSRDALPKGGRIQISCQTEFIDDEAKAANLKIPPGEYVLFEVVDDGDGMSRETLSRAIEPFFSTKDVGDGSGLGLSMVHGFAKQSGGRLLLSSETGEGTTAHLYLPVGKREPNTEPVPLRNYERPVPLTNRETVLLVEDSDPVRVVTCAMLERLGYDVVNADQAEKALKLIENGLSFDILISDVVLPGPLTGVDLVNTVKSGFPGIRSLLISGYAGVDLTSGEDQSLKTPLLTKPFGFADLAQALNRI